MKDWTCDFFHSQYIVTVTKQKYEDGKWGKRIQYDECKRCTPEAKYT